MSLAAQIRLESSNRLLISLILVGVGGFVLAMAAILARFNSGLPIDILTGLLAGILLLSLIGGWRAIHRLSRVPLSLRILDDGSVEIGSVSRLAGMRAQAGHYQLAPGSLLWPGLYILRLQAVNLHLDAEHKPVPTVSIVIFKQILSESNRRALARWLIWAQHKTQGKTLGTSFLPLQSPTN